MIKAIITDIEGTTTDIHFVHKVLFPYSRSRMADFVKTNAESPAVAPVLQEIAAGIGPTATQAEMITQLIAWIDQDVKAGSLKTLQGYIWQKGFEEGAFTGHVYPDAYENLVKWHQAGIKLYIYSSGSVQAQKLLFQYSDFGNLLYLFTDHFDTAVGAKKEAASYANILKSIQFDADNVLFLSDVVAELDAARENGIQTQLLNRDGAMLNANGHPACASFADIKVD